MINEKPVKQSAGVLEVLSPRPLVSYGGSGAQAKSASGSFSCVSQHCGD